MSFDLNHLLKTPIVAILRKLPLDTSTQVGSVLHDAGIDVLEVTLDSEEPILQLERLQRALPDAKVGIGSVLSIQQLQTASAAGAHFVVCPIVDDDVIRCAVDCGLPIIPGAATPTEIQRALDAGATAVKVFPAAQLGGPDFIASIRAPLGHPPLIPTGGVHIHDAGEYLAAGAVAVGVGSALVPRSHSEHRVEGEGYADLAARWHAAVTSDA